MTRQRENLPGQKGGVLLVQKRKQDGQVTLTSRNSVNELISPVACMYVLYGTMVGP